MPGQQAWGWTEGRAPSALFCPLYSPPCSHLCLVGSWLAVYGEEEEAIHCSQNFVKSTEKVSMVPSPATVPVSRDGHPQLCCQPTGGLLAGQRGSVQCPTRHCTLSALIVLAMGFPSHTLPLSPACQDEAQKVCFLQSIHRLCRSARHKGLLQGLGLFCHSQKLADHIRVRGQPEGLGKGERPPGTGTL